MCDSLSARLAEIQPFAAQHVKMETAACKSRIASVTIRRQAGWFEILFQTTAPILMIISPFQGFI
jgi:hypothetical protein